MNQEDILALVRAGFTRQEILAMNQTHPAADPQPADPQQAPDPEPDTQPEQPEQQDLQPADDPKPSADPAMESILKELKELRATIQAQNRNNAQQPGQNRTTGEDILAAMIRPPRKENNNA